MALYIYQCKKCNHVFEVKHGMTYEGQITCPECDTDQTKKLVTCPAIVLDWKNLPPEEGAIAQAGKRFRPSAVPQSVRDTL